jgi:hypothetical protein
MHEYEKRLRTYKRNHKGDSFKEAEESKIHRQKIQGTEMEKRMKSFIDTLYKLPGETDSYIENYRKMIHDVNNMRRGVKTYKDRLHELEKNEEFLDIIDCMGECDSRQEKPNESYIASVL